MYMLFSMDNKHATLITTHENQEVLSAIGNVLLTQEITQRETLRQLKLPNIPSSTYVIANLTNVPPHQQRAIHAYMLQHTCSRITYAYVKGIQEQNTDAINEALTTMLQSV